MVEIPEYVASKELDTDRRGMPQPVVMSGAGEGMQMLGRAISQLGAHIQQQMDKKDATKANYALEDLRNATAQKQYDIIQNAPESGEGMHDELTTWFDQKRDEIAKTIDDPERREAFIHHSNTVRTQYSIDTAEKEYQHNKGFHTRNTEKTAADRSMSLADDPDRWQPYWEEMQKWVDDLPNMTKADRAELKQNIYERLAIGKSIGDTTKDPEEAKAKIGFPIETKPGKKLPIRFERQPGRTSYTTDVNPTLIDKWEQVQGAVGFQASVISARRKSPKELYPHLSEKEAIKKAGYKPTSQHVHGDALDINLRGLSVSQRQAIIRGASAAGFGGINVYPGGNTLHVDLGEKRHWNAQPSWAQKAIADHEAGRRVSPSGPFDSGVVSTEQQRTRVASLETPMVPADQPVIATPNQMNTIANEEDLKLKAYWDTDKYRVGYGSDTYTDADGNKHPVTKDTVITKEDAARDLKRRTPEFIGVIKRQIGEEAWNNLSQKARDVLPSFAYQHGSLTAPVKAAALTGDDEAIAKAIETDKFTPERRAREAAYLRGEGEDVPYSPASDRASGSAVGEGGTVQVTDPAYSGMSIQWRLQRLGQIEAEQARIAAERQKQAAVVLESSKEDMLAALRTSGEYTGEDPSLELFMTADPRKGYAQWREFQIEKATAATVNQISTMDVSQARKIRQELHELIPKGEMADVYARAYKDVDDAVKTREKEYDAIVGTLRDSLKVKLAEEQEMLEEGFKERDDLQKKYEDRRERARGQIVTERHREREEAIKAEKEATEEVEKKYGERHKKILEQTIEEQNRRRGFYVESDEDIKAGIRARDEEAERRAKIRVANVDNIYAALKTTGQFPEKDVPKREDFILADNVNGMENYLTYLEKSWAAIASNEMFTANEKRIAEIKSEAAADAKTKAKQDAAEIVQKAAEAVVKEREEDPFGAVLAHYDAAKNLWDEVEKDPTSQSLKQAAVNMTFEIQKSWGMPNQNLAILPKADADAIVSHFKNPERETQANQAELITLLDSFDDHSAKVAIMGQLTRSGLPRLNGPAVDAYLSGRSEIGVTNLFEAARSTRIAKGEEDITEAKLGEIVRDEFIRRGGGNYYGTHTFSAYNNERFDNAVDLLTKSARMRMAAEVDQDTAISSAITDLLGDDEKYDDDLRSGPRVRLLLKPDDDENAISKGLNRFIEGLIKQGIEDINKLSPVISPGVPDPDKPGEFIVEPGTEDYAATAQRNLERQNVINSVMRHGIFVNYEDGFALYNSALQRYLADENGQPMIVTREMLDKLYKNPELNPFNLGMPGYEE